MSSNKPRHKQRERELLVVKLLIMCINKKNKNSNVKLNLSRLKPTFLKVSGGTHWDETRGSVNAWNPFQTRVKPVLVCSVDRSLKFILLLSWSNFFV